MVKDGRVFVKTDPDEHRPTEYKQCTVHTTGHWVGPDCLEAVIHKCVIQYIKKKHGYIADFVVPGIGELRGDSSRGLRITESGYVPGQPDILIIVPNGKYFGLAIELKRYSSNPSKRGKLSKRQADLLNKYDRLGYKTLVSCELDSVCNEIDKYCKSLSLVKCKYCRDLIFLNKGLLKLHISDYHRVSG